MFVVHTRWAPINIPFERRIQTFCVLVALTFQIFTIIFSLALFVIFPLLIIVYLLWIVFVDKAPSNGKGRRSEWFRRLKFWRHFANYFPSKLHKSVDLDPNKHYIFGYHPHGIVSIGAFSNFATEATGFSEKFPGISVHLLTLPAQFYNPFWREILLALGVGDVGWKSCKNILQGRPGSSLMIVIGGANEALYAKPGTNDLTLKKRKGFVKLALTEGASLVPVFGFGETDLWNQVPNPKGSIIRGIQDKMKNVITWTVPLIRGRGIFQYDFGLLPYRSEINVVVGRPIDCPKITAPPNSQEFTETVDKYHQIYTDSLRALYDEHKDTFAKNRKSALNIVE